MKDYYPFYVNTLGNHEAALCKKFRIKNKSKFY